MTDKYYIGTDLKFLLQAECEGYSMSDGFEIELLSGGKMYKCTQDDVCQDEEGNWYLMIDSSMFGAGDLKMIFKAKVPDMDFSDNERTEIAVVDLCKLTKLPI